MAKRGSRVALCGVVMLLTALAGCGGTPPVAPGQPPATPALATARPPIDSAAILAQLRPTALLAEAAAQCAAVFGAPADQVRIRIETPKEQDCVPCNRLPIGALNRGAPVAEIALPLEAGSWVWATVGDWLCIYLFDGQAYKPSSVTQW